MAAGSVFLGVDGGGTKTALCLVDSSGAVLARARAASSYYVGEGLDRVERVLRDGVAEVCERAGTAPGQVTHAFFGLPGYGESGADVPALDDAPRAALGHDRYACDNDLVAGWAGSLATVDGINVVSGTGSMAYGQRAGRRARAGGWGELFGDEGSAYWVAARGLRAFTRMSDGRAPAGLLLEVLREHLALPRDLDLVDVVLSRWKGGRAEIAALCPVPAAGAADGRAPVLHDQCELLTTRGRTARARGQSADGDLAVDTSDVVAPKTPARPRERFPTGGGAGVRGELDASSSASSSGPTRDHRRVADG